MFKFACVFVGLFARYRYSKREKVWLKMKGFLGRLSHFEISFVNIVVVSRGMKW